MKPVPDGKFTAFIGIDWADSKHDICLQAADSEQREFDRFAHRVDRIEQWACAMRQRFGGPIALALELSKGPLVYALQKYDFFVLFPINPSMLAKYREAFKPSRAKDDPSDAQLALDLLLHHRDRLNPLKPQSAQMRTLLYLVEQRRRLVGDKTRFTNRLGLRAQAILSASTRLVRANRHDVVLRFPDPLADAGEGQTRPQGEPRDVLPGPQRALRLAHRRANRRHQDRHTAH